MLKFFVLPLLQTIVHYTDFVSGQTGGTTAAGDGYSCVPASYCTNGNPPSPGIDPRIVTPGQLCPAGLIPCYTQGPNSMCGIRYVQQTNFADGPAQAGVHPWQAYLRNSTHPIYAGSGVLLDNYHVLTAAHKVVNSINNPASVTVFMGVYNPAQIAMNTQNRTVAAIRVYDGSTSYFPFNTTTLWSDIAILRLSQPFALSQPNINTACLPQSGASYLRQRCVVAGWGRTSFPLDDSPTNPMKQVYVNITDPTTCRTALGQPNVLGQNVNLFLDTAGEICAGGESMKDACIQDGGAPLICTLPPANRATIAGLVIWGKNCGQPGVYGVYVNVAFAAYRQWISTQINTFNMG